MSDVVNENEINTLTGYLGSEFQLKLMWQLLVEPEFAEKIIPLLSIEYFDDPSMKKLFIIMLQYYNDNTKVPNLQNQSIYLAIQKYKSQNDPIEEEILLAIITKIKLWNERVINKNILNDGDVVQRETFLFIKQQEYRKLSEYIQEKVKSGGIKAKNIVVDIEDKIKKIDNIGNDEDYGISILEDIKRALRKEFRDTIPTGIGFLDEITKGGLGRGEVGIIISPSGYGKSTALTKIANTAVNNGKNVLQIIFEDTEDQIRRKHFAVWSGIPLSQFENHEELVEERVIKYFNDNEQGQLIIMKFSEDDTTIPQIKQWIERYHKKFGIKFDMIVLDYLDCVESHKKHTDALEGEKTVIKAFMGMIAEFNIPGWSALQGNRLSFNSELVDVAHVGGNVKRVQKTHLLISIGKTPEQKENDLANIKIIKARFAKDGQVIKDCIFNNDTLEIRATDNSWKTTLKKYNEEDLESIEDKTNRLHAEVSKYSENDATVNDVSLMADVNFETDNKEDDTNNEIKSSNNIVQNNNIINDDDFFKKLEQGYLNDVINKKMNS